MFLKNIKIIITYLLALIITLEPTVNYASVPSYVKISADILGSNDLNIISSQDSSTHILKEKKSGTFSSTLHSIDAHDWQVLNGILPVGKRLVPKIPFIMGGEYYIQNLYAEDTIESMKRTGNIANKINNFPDGTSIKSNIILNDKNI